jgi:hypothetical protein
MRTVQPDRVDNANGYGDTALRTVEEKGGYAR